MRGTQILLLAACLTVCCSRQGRDVSAAQAGAPAQAVAADAVTPPPAGQVTFPSGRVFFVDLALTLEQQARGYMGRKALAPDEGLLFYYERAGVRAFWMKNCLTELDIIWLDDDDHVVYIEHSAPPCREDPCPSYSPGEPATNVLEVAGGTAPREGLKPGDRLEIVTDLKRP